MLKKHEFTIPTIPKKSGISFEKSWDLGFVNFENLGISKFWDFSLDILSKYVYTFNVIEFVKQKP